LRPGPPCRVVVTRRFTISLQAYPEYRAFFLALPTSRPGLLPSWPLPIHGPPLSFSSLSSSSPGPLPLLLPLSPVPVRDRLPANVLVVLCACRSVGNKLPPTPAEPCCMRQRTRDSVDHRRDQVSRCRSKSASLTVSVGRGPPRPGSSPWEGLGLISDPACPPAGITAGGARRTEAAASGPAPGFAQRPQTRPYGNRPALRCRLGGIMPVALRLPPPRPGVGSGILVDSESGAPLAAAWIGVTDVMAHRTSGYH
jgi:hypothetical protein